MHDARDRTRQDGEAPRRQAHPCTASGKKCLLPKPPRPARVPPRKSPAGGTPSIENHKNIDHLSSNSHCKYRIYRQNDRKI